jgi:hypothetical protein
MLVLNLMTLARHLFCYGLIGCLVFFLQPVFADQVPVVNDLVKIMKEDKKVAIALKGKSPFRKKLSYAIVQPPQHGSFTLKGNKVQYTPQANYFGPDEFQYQASDGTLTSIPATVTLTITPVNDRPVALPQTAIVGKGVPSTITLAATDVEGDPLTYRITAKPKRGRVTINGNVVTYTPKKADFEGKDRFAFKVKDENKTSKAARVDLVVKPINQGGYFLNDTGITTCADEADNGFACPVAGFPEQDAEHGRDATDNDDSDGHAGFSFTKISITGMELTADATEWSCVKDNVTGLMWEVKTDDSGLRDLDNTYTWYEPDSSKNGGNAGTQNGGNCTGSACDTHSYVQAVNAAVLCGVSDWRMPSRNELRGIASLDHVNPAIDTDYFPDTSSSAFWSSSPYANGGDFAWGFGDGYGGWGGKGSSFSVRLVRSGQ